LGDVLKLRQLLKGVTQTFFFWVSRYPLTQYLLRLMDFRQSRRIKHLFKENFSLDVFVFTHKILLVTPNSQLAEHYQLFLFSARSRSQRS
jgi:hypothetical protein